LPSRLQLHGDELSEHVFENPDDHSEIVDEQVELLGDRGAPQLDVGSAGTGALSCAATACAGRIAGDSDNEAVVCLGDRAPLAQPVEGIGPRRNVRFQGPDLHQINVRLQARLGEYPMVAVSAWAQHLDDEVLEAEGGDDPIFYGDLTIGG